MQISGDRGARAYTSVAQCVRLMVATEGAGALFSGLAPTLIRSLPNLGLQFLLYETIKRAIGL